MHARNRGGGKWEGRGGVGLAMGGIVDLRLGRDPRRENAATKHVGEDTYDDKEKKSISSRLGGATRSTRRVFRGSTGDPKHIWAMVGHQHTL